MRPTLEKILDETLRANQMSKEYYEENNKSRLQKIVTIRQVVSLIGQEYGYSQPKIGRFLGQDHSTVYHNKIMAKQHCEYEKDYAEMVSSVSRKLKQFYPIKNVLHCDCCCDCDVFKNHQGKKFILGFHCPIMDKYVGRNESACEFVLSDELIF